MNNRNFMQLKSLRIYLEHNSSHAFFCQNCDTQTSYVFYLHLQATDDKDNTACPLFCLCNKLRIYTEPMANTSGVTKTLQKFFVGNLPWTVGHQELRAYFKDFGKVVSANVIFNKKTGCSRGFGFVTFSSPSATDKIESEPNHIIEGNHIRIQRS